MTFTEIQCINFQVQALFLVHAATLTPVTVLQVIALFQDGVPILHIQYIVSIRTTLQLTYIIFQIMHIQTAISSLIIAYLVAVTAKDIAHLLQRIVYIGIAIFRIQTKPSLMTSLDKVFTQAFIVKVIKESVKADVVTYLDTVLKLVEIVTTNMEISIITVPMFIHSKGLTYLVS